MLLLCHGGALCKTFCKIHLILAGLLELAVLGKVIDSQCVVLLQTKSIELLIGLAIHLAYYVFDMRISEKILLCPILKLKLEAIAFKLPFFLEMVLEQVTRYVLVFPQKY